VAEWCEAAGLDPAPPRRLAGDPLTVVIWTAQRPASAPPLLVGDLRETVPDAALERELH